MKNQLISMILACSIIVQPFYAYSTDFGFIPSSSKSSSSNCSNDLRKKPFYVEELGIPEHLIKATHEFVEAGEHRKPNVVERLAKKIQLVFSKLFLPITYVRGDSHRSTEVDQPILHILRKDIVVNGKTQEAVAFLVSMPGDKMFRSERKALEEFASNFKRFGVPTKYPHLEINKMGFRWFVKEYGWMKFWGHYFSKKASDGLRFIIQDVPRFFLITSSLGLIYNYPLYEKIHKLKLKEADDEGNITYRKVYTDPADNEVVYLLDGHRPNGVEDADLWGANIRAGLVLFLLYNSLAWGADLWNSGISQIDWKIKLPLFLLFFSRALAYTLDKIISEDGKTKINRKNIKIATKRVKTFLHESIQRYKNKEIDNPSQTPEEAFEYFKVSIRDDNYPLRGLISFVGHETEERDGKYYYKNKTIANHIPGAFTLYRTPEQQSLMEFIENTPNVDPNDLGNVKIILEKKSNGEEVIRNVNFGNELSNLDEALDEQMASYSEPVFIMIPQAQMKGVYKRLKNDHGFQPVLSGIKPQEKKAE